MSNKIITIEITEKEYENYSEYCKLLNTNCEEDLIEYLRARSKEAEKYITKNTKKTGRNYQNNKNNLKSTDNYSQNASKEKYIYLKGNHFNIQKQTNGIKLSYGSYKTLEEAIKQRDFLIKENWDEKYAKHRNK